MAFDFADLTPAEKVSAVYVAFYGRAADPGGRAFWADQLEQAGGDLSAIIDAFATSEETQQRFGTETNTQAVQTLYRQIFNREPEAAGLEFYVDALEAGTLSRSAIALDILNGAQGGDADIVANKLTAAEAFTDAVAGADVAASLETTRFVVSGVDASQASVETAQAATQAIVGTPEPIAVSGDVREDGAPVETLTAQAGAVAYGDPAGSLAITGDQEVTFTSDNFDNLRVGADPDGTGFLLVRGQDARLTTVGTGNTVQVAEAGQGTMLVDDGATITTLNLGVGRSGRGEAVLSGEGTRAVITPANGQNAGEFSGEGGYVGVARTDGSYGRLLVADGALLDITTTEATPNGAGLQLGRNAGSRGEVIVDNAAVRATNTGAIEAYGSYVTVGRAGEATLDVRNDGRLILSGESSSINVGRDGGSVGTLSVTSGSETEALFYNFARNAESEATVEVAGAGTVLTARGTAGPSTDFAGEGAFITVGRGGSADMSVADGARVVVTTDAGNFPGMQIARNPGSTGEMAVTGGDTAVTFENTSTAFANSTFTVGRGGTGRLDVEAGAEISGLLFMNVGSEAEGDGTLRVDGDGTEISLVGTSGPQTQEAGNGAFLTVGRDGVGRVEVTDGAVVSITSETGAFPGFQLGRNADGEGSMLVSGADTRVEVTSGGDTAGLDSGFLVIGRNGTGTLDVRDGGAVVNDPAGVMAVGANPGATGTVTVAGGTVDAGANLLIGVQPPAFEGFDPADIDFSQGGTGTVTVDSVGTLNAGAAAGDDVDDIFIGAGGTLEVADGGTLAGDVRNEGGTFAMGQSPGRVEVAGDFNSTGELVFDIDGTEPGRFDQLDVNGTATLSGSVRLAFGADADMSAGDTLDLLIADDGLDAQEIDVAVTGLDADLRADASIAPTGLSVTLVSDDSAV